MKTLLSLLVILVGMSAAMSSAANGCDSYISSCTTISAGSQTVCLDSDINTASDYNCITIDEDADNLVFDCQGYRITNLEEFGLRYGIRVLEDADWVTIRDCEVNQWNTGIYSLGNDGVIEYNKFFDNIHGITLNNYNNAKRRASGNEIAFNKIDDQLGWGILVSGNADGNDVHDNTVHNSGSDGIRCTYYITLDITPDLNTFDHNQVNQNAGRGFYLQDCHDGWVTYNTANMNGEDGLRLGYVAADSIGNSVEKNKFNRNGGYGIYEDPGSENGGAVTDSNVCKANDAGASFPDDYFCK